MAPTLPPAQAEVKRLAILSLLRPGAQALPKPFQKVPVEEHPGLLSEQKQPSQTESSAKHATAAEPEKPVLPVEVQIYI